MVKYLGPKVKIIRKFGLLPGLTKKTPKNKKKTPGQHGKPIFLTEKRSYLSHDYKLRLFEKQKLRFNYGLSEKQLFSYYQKAKNKKISTGFGLMQLIESRLDCVVFRLGFAISIPQARQFINHDHILVNNKSVNISSFQLKLNDKVSIKSKNKSQKLILSNFLKQKVQQELIEQNKNQQLITSKLKYNNTIPNYLEVNLKKELPIGIIKKTIGKKDNLIIINKLRILEYYSR